RADLPGGFLDGNEAFPAVNVRPDGVLNRGWDADPLLDLDHIEVAPVFATWQLSHAITEPRLNFDLGEQFPGAFLDAEQRVHGADAGRILESASHIATGRIVGPTAGS